MPNTARLPDRLERKYPNAGKEEGLHLPVQSLDFFG